MSGIEFALIEQLAGGGWARLRNLLGALDRVDRLETSSDFAGWLNGLAEDESGLERVIRDFNLRAFRLVGDPVNSRILTRLIETGPASTNDLISSTGIQRVEVVERINELGRAGLTVQALEEDKVEATAFARGYLVLLQEVTTQMMRLAANDYLLNPKVSPVLPRTRQGFEPKA